MASIGNILNNQNSGFIYESKFAPQSTVGNAKATRVANQSQDNLVNVGVAKSAGQNSHENDMFAHQRHIALQGYLNYGKEDAATDQAQGTVRTAGQSDSGNNALQNYIDVTGAPVSFTDSAGGISGEPRSSAAETADANTTVPPQPQQAAPAAPATTAPAARSSGANPAASAAQSVVTGTEGAANNAQGQQSGPVSQAGQSGQADKAGQADKSSGIDGSGSKSVNGKELTEEEQAEVEDMKARDAEVRTHEQAHKSAGGQYAASPSYTYENGPDGKRYITDGEVSIDIGKEDDPQATIDKMQIVKRAALAPAQPSAQDRKVYAEASQKEAEARQELAQEQKEEQESGKSAAANAAAATGAGAAAGTGAAEGAQAQGNNAAQAQNIAGAKSRQTEPQTTGNPITSRAAVQPQSAQQPADRSADPMTPADNNVAPKTQEQGQATGTTNSNGVTGQNSATEPKSPSDIKPDDIPEPKEVAPKKLSNDDSVPSLI